LNELNRDYDEKLSLNSQMLSLKYIQSYHTKSNFIVLWDLELPCFEVTSEIGKWIGFIQISDIFKALAKVIKQKFNERPLLDICIEGRILKDDVIRNQDPSFQELRSLLIFNKCIQFDDNNNEITVDPFENIKWENVNGLLITRTELDDCEDVESIYRPIVEFFLNANLKCKRLILLADSNFDFTQRCMSRSTFPVCAIECNSSCDIVYTINTYDFLKAIARYVSK
jgi:hypothetical protein